jgi:hypothetical protein
MPAMSHPSRHDQLTDTLGFGDEEEHIEERKDEAAKEDQEDPEWARVSTGPVRH